eukprot:768284-Hanusia_phi.AAC.5
MGEGEREGGGGGRRGATDKTVLEWRLHGFGLQNRTGGEDDSVGGGRFNRIVGAAYRRVLIGWGGPLTGVGVNKDKGGYSSQLDRWGFGAAERPGGPGPARPGRRGHADNRIAGTHAMMMPARGARAPGPRPGPAGRGRSDRTN